MYIPTQSRRVRFAPRRSVTLEPNTTDDVDAAKTRNAVTLALMIAPLIPFTIGMTVLIGYLIAGAP